MKNISEKMWCGTVVAVVLLAGTGCRSKTPEIQPRDYTAVPLYMAGQEIPADDQEKYLHHGTVKMYSVGRLVDPASGTMREAGTVYRVESAPRWNLIPQYDANPESFARKAMKEQYADSVLGQMSRTMTAAREVQREVTDSRAELDRLQKMYDALKQENAKLLKQIQKGQEDDRMALQNMRLMQKYIQKLERRVEDLKMRNFGDEK